MNCGRVSPGSSGWPLPFRGLKRIWVRLFGAEVEPVADAWDAGLAYEVIRFAGKHPENRLLRGLLAPGLWLQRLTTREPTLDQIEVSIRALREVLRLEGRITPEERKVEVMA